MNIFIARSIMFFDLLTFSVVFFYFIIIIILFIIHYRKKIWARVPSYERVYMFHAFIVYTIFGNIVRVESGTAYTRARYAHTRWRTKQWVIFRSCRPEGNIASVTALTNYCKYEFMRKMSTVSRECVSVYVCACKSERERKILIQNP